MPSYSEKVMEHFMSPHNVGTIEEADGVGEVGNAVCGDMMTFYIKVKDNRLEDVKFQTFGCGAAIAVSSMITDMARGKTLEEALAITNKDVADELGGLPSNKMHCSNLGADALRKAIENYQLKESGIEVPAPSGAKPDKMPHDDEECLCPYCDSALAEVIPFCKGCGQSLKICSQCGFPQSRDAKFCSECGSEL
jgi:nitrogen fixation NifU-like protein